MAYQVLSLSGGGYMGLYTITLLAKLEQHFQRPIYECFDLIAGTSIGGIIALGLAAEKTAAEIKYAFEQHGTEIFSDRPVPKTHIAALREIMRSWSKPKYNDQALKKR